MTTQLYLGRPPTPANATDTPDATDATDAAHAPDAATTPAAPERHSSHRRAGAVAIAVLVPLGGLVTRLPAVVLLPVLVVVLAGIDLVAGVIGKSWAASHSAWTMAAGCVLYGVLFWLYAISLRYGELSTVTIAWVVLLTVGDMVLDRFYYNVHFGTPKWVAAGAAVLLLAVLLAPDVDES